MRWLSVIMVSVAMSLLSTSARAVGPEGYKKAPDAIREVLDAPATPFVWPTPTGDNLLMLRPRFHLPIAKLAEPMLRLAGVRFHPHNNAPHSTSLFYDLVIQSVEDGRQRTVKLPANADLGNIRVNATGTMAAFTNTTDSTVQLWILDIGTGKARQIKGIDVNAILGSAIVWRPDQRSLIVKTIPTRRAAPPKATAAPPTPRIEVSTEKVAPSSTYEARDLLKTPHDADLFEHYATSQLAIVQAGSGRVQRIGRAAVLDDVSSSPNGKYILVRRIKRPFSLTRPYWRFPAAVELWDTKGTVVERLADQPMADKVPIHGVPTAPRQFSWQATAPATLVWAKALDGGDTYKEVPKHDRVMRKVVGRKATPLFDTSQRYGGLQWIEGGRQALLHEWDRGKHRAVTRLLTFNGDEVSARVLWDRDYDDRYGDPGRPIMHPLRSGAYVVAEHQGSIYLSGRGATPKGRRPFIDRLDLSTLKTERLFRSNIEGIESYAGVFDPAKGTFLTSHQSPTEPSNIWERTLGGAVAKPAEGEAARTSKVRKLTSFTDPTPVIRTVSKKLVTYERADGIPLSFTLYLPPGYKNGTPLPTALWAYPLDFTDKKSAGQVRSSPQSFTRTFGASPILLALAGYAVLADVAMPVVGPTENAYDTFVEQITANAEAAINKAVEMGVTDRDRVGVFGHSHGALMTANLLIWTDLFRAGVARSGAYNHTLRPFGFQNERRTFYQAQQTYLGLSPTLHADQVDDPLLIIHGAIDANPGTTPQQSEKLYEAVRGAGGVARLVMLPHESHGYAARESVEHVVAETIDWFDTHVKHAKPRKAKPNRSPNDRSTVEAAVPECPAVAETPAARVVPAEPPCDRRCRRRRRRAERRAQR